MTEHLSVASLVRQLATQLRGSARALAVTDNKQRTQALLAAAECLRQHHAAILQANQQDKHNATESGQHTSGVSRPPVIGRETSRCHGDKHRGGCGSA